MSADFYCLLCHSHFDGDTFPEHVCGGKITCKHCDLSGTVAWFVNHACIPLLLSTPSTAAHASASTEKRNRRSPSSVPHPSMGRRAFLPRVAPPSLPPAN